MSIELANPPEAVNLAEEVDLHQLVDELAGIQAKAADLETRATEIKTTLAASGEKQIVGSLHKANISVIADSVTTDWKAACVAAKVKPAVLAQCQKKKAGYTVVKLAAR